MSKNLTKLDHPVLQHKLGYLRDKESSTLIFRGALREVSQLLAYEAMRNESTEKVKVESPMSTCEINRITTEPIIVSIMRAGNPMQEAILDMMPFCRAGHIGIYRDKFIENTVEYYFKLPNDCKGSEVILVDPLMATGDTMVAAVDRLKQYEVGKIKLLTIITNPRGVDKLHHFHPDVEVYTVGFDEELNEQGYIIPGIGDAGDRLFKTK
jgi:uracil phosphoribosyltransferase